MLSHRERECVAALVHPEGNHESAQKGDISLKPNTQHGECKNRSGIWIIQTREKTKEVERERERETKGKEKKKTKTLGSSLVLWSSHMILTLDSWKVLIILKFHF